MKAVFNLTRDRQEELYYTEFTDDSGIFHFHSPVELYFVFEGQMEVFINDKRHVMQAGEMSVALGFDAHAYRTIGHSRSAVLIIPPYMCRDFIEAVKNKKVTSPFICDRHVVEQIQAALAKLRSPDCNPIKRTGYLYVILGTLMEHLDLRPIGDTQDTKLSSRLLGYINEHYKEELSLSTLCAAFGYSREYLSKYFKSHFQIGLSHYVTMIRLRAAASLLQEQRHSITYCALESGFRSMRTFYRAFFEEFGCSPKEYLKSTGVNTQ